MAIEWGPHTKAAADKLAAELRLSVQQLNYLKSIKKTGTYGRTVATVVRTFIDAGVREAIDRKYITITDDGSDD
jgi:hypothetical protein